jgi:N-acyl homoserine lactone hydrolase
MEWPQARYRTVEGDTELMPGLHLLATPGHSPGHLSLLLHLPVSGWVLLAGDAISRPDEARQGFAGSWNPALAAHHAQRIMKLAEEHQAMVIFGHDPQQWPTLRKAPEHYG